MSKYIVLDLEMCKIPKSQTVAVPLTEAEIKETERPVKDKEGHVKYIKRKTSRNLASEIIQIGAVLLDENYEIVSKFNRYVKPAIGALNSFITNLTGITQNELKDAAYLPEVLEEFAEWMPEDVIFVAWSGSDEMQLKCEMRYKGLEVDCITRTFGHWIDCQKLFDKKIKRSRNSSLEEALIATNIWQEGRAHDGLDDAYNTAVLFARLQTEPDLKLNTAFLESQSEESSHLSFSLGSLFAGLDFGGGEE